LLIHYPKPNPNPYLKAVAIYEQPFLTRLHSPDCDCLRRGNGNLLQTQNLTAEDFGGPQYEGCNEYLVHTKPEAVEKVHRDFLAVERM